MSDEPISEEVRMAAVELRQVAWGMQSKARDLLIRAEQMVPWKAGSPSPEPDDGRQDQPLVALLRSERAMREALRRLGDDADAVNFMVGSTMPASVATLTKNARAARDLYAPKESGQGGDGIQACSPSLGSPEEQIGKWVIHAASMRNPDRTEWVRGYEAALLHATQIVGTDWENQCEAREAKS